MLAQKKSNITYRAFRLDDGLPSWYEEHVIKREGGPSPTWVRRGAEGWVIQTLEGMEHAADDDWCVEGSMGEYYPMSDESFHSRYEPAKDGRWRRVGLPLECWLFDTTNLGLMPAWVQKAIRDGLIDANGDELTVHATWGDQLATLGDDVLIHAKKRGHLPVQGGYLRRDLQCHRQR